MTRLLVLESQATRITDVSHLPELARPGDVWVVNDAATFPASLQARTDEGNEVELRLLPHLPDTDSAPWQAVVFGRGDWRMKTEDRPAPPAFQAGCVLTLGAGLSATVREACGRLLTLDFSLQGPALWKRIYELGRPVQYSYVSEPYELWDVQTPFASRPWASEMPSAGRPLSWEILKALKARGAEIHSLTHATGLSSTGDPELDAQLPLPEFYEIPAETVVAIQAARARGSRVIAVGTSVLRALEGCRLTQGRLRAGRGVTDLRVGPGFRRQVVDGIFSGIHSAGESHYELLQSFFPKDRLDQASRLAQAEGFRNHELGDASLLLSARGA